MPELFPRELQDLIDEGAVFVHIVPCVDGLVALGGPVRLFGKQVCGADTDRSDDLVEGASGEAAEQDASVVM